MSLGSHWVHPFGKNCILQFSGFTGSPWVHPGFTHLGSWRMQYSVRGWTQGEPIGIRGCNFWPRRPSCSHLWLQFEAVLTSINLARRWLPAEGLQFCARNRIKEWCVKKNFKRGGRVLINPISTKLRVPTIYSNWSGFLFPTFCPYHAFLYASQQNIRQHYYVA